MSYKKKQQLYITRRSGHHHMNKPQDRNKRTQHNTPPPSTTWERISKQSRRHQQCVTPKPQPAAGLNDPPELLQHGTITLKLHTRSSIPLIRRSFNKHSHLSSRGYPLILTTLRGGLASPTASLLCQGLIYLRPQ
jgi:hypothetical protein